MQGVYHATLVIESRRCNSDGNAVGSPIAAGTVASRLGDGNAGSGDAGSTLVPVSLSPPVQVLQATIVGRAGYAQIVVRGRRGVVSTWALFVPRALTACFCGHVCRQTEPANVIDFGHVEYGQPAEKQLALVNKSLLPTRVHTFVAPPFSIAQPSVLLLPTSTVTRADRRDLKVTVTPQDTGLFSEAVTLLFGDQVMSVQVRAVHWYPYVPGTIAQVYFNRD
mgnify:CR=1 FL=1